MSAPDLTSSLKLDILIPRQSASSAVRKKLPVPPENTKCSAFSSRTVDLIFHTSAFARRLAQ